MAHEFTILITSFIWYMLCVRWCTCICVTALRLYHTEEGHNLCHRYKSEILKKKNGSSYIHNKSWHSNYNFLLEMVEYILMKGCITFTSLVIQQKSTRFLKPNSCISNIPSIFCLVTSYTTLQRLWLQLICHC